MMMNARLLEQVEAIVRDRDLLLSMVPEAKPSGGDTFRAKCPIHGGTRLSFGIKSTGGGWKFMCWACGAHGSAIDLCRALEGCDFREALRRLGAPDRRSIVPLWAPPKPKAFVLPCEGKGCGARLELEAIEVALVEAAHPSWRFRRVDGQVDGLCPRCSLKLAQRSRRFLVPARRAA